MCLFGIQGRLDAASKFAVLVGDACCTQLVVAACQISHPAAGTSEAFGDVIGNPAFGNEVKSPPAEFFSSLPTAAITLVQLFGCEMVFEFDWAWHNKFLNHLTLFCKPVLQAYLWFQSVLQGLLNRLSKSD